VLTVKWLLLTLTTPVVAPQYLDIEATSISLSGSPGALTLALYGATGNLLQTEAGADVVSTGTSPALSFGSTDSRGIGLDGQDGTLGTGNIWIALAAGSPPEVSTGGTDWNVTTSSSLQLGLLQPGASFVTLSVTVGNTLPVVAPANVSCLGALTISENSNGQPAWIGSNALATSDATFPCYNTSLAPLPPKDLWFRYVPTATGTVQITANGEPNSFLAPVLATFDACDSVAQQCVSGSGAPESFGQPVTITLPVVQGQPVLLALGAFAAATGTLQLDINFLTPECLADVAGPDQSVGPDGVLTADDIIVFLGWFFASDERANIAGPDQSTTPDTSFTADDIIVFLGRYFAGC